MALKIGVVFGSTGGTKLYRTVRSFRKMEPDLPIHVVIDESSFTWKHNPASPSELLDAVQCPIKCVINKAHINGCLNSCIDWVGELGYDYACLFHDDLVFSPLPEHAGSISKWLDNEELILKSSGIRLSHFETFTNDIDSRRPSEEWDKEDLESEELWQFLKGYTCIDGTEIRPPNKSFWFKYEGPDKVRKWNRLGPTGQIVPVQTWRDVGRFDEKEGIFYDQEYPSECYFRKLPPVWSVPNFPYIHLHNQSMNPWGDPAPGPWSDCMKAYGLRFKARFDKPEPWAAFWGDDWEEKWA